MAGGMTLDTLGEQLGNQIYNILYAVIAAIVLQLILLIKKGYKMIQIWRNKMPTNYKLFKEIESLKKSGDEEDLRVAQDMRDAYVNLNRARERGRSRLSIHEKNKPEIKIEKLLTP